MFDYLFNSAFKISFAPFAITAILWALLAFCIFRKKNKLFFYLFTGAFFFMLFWRIACHSIMVSSRYSSVLILPLMIFCGCFVVKVQPLFRWLFRKIHWDFPHRNLFCRLLPVALIVGLSMGCFLKIARINPHASFVEDICKIYLKHRRTPGELHVTHKEQERVAWYAKVPLRDIRQLHIPGGTPEVDVLRKRVESLSNIPGDHYFVFYLEKNDPEPSKEFMGLTQDPGSWEIIAQRYTDKRKKKRLLLTRYTPSCPNIRQWNAPIPPQPAGNILKDGDFEKVFTGKGRENLQNFYRKEKIAPYCNTPQRKLPVGWWINISKWNKKNPPDVCLSSSAPLAGKYSLSVDALPPRSRGNCHSWFNAGNRRCRYTLFVRAEGKKETFFTFVASARSNKSKNWKYMLEHRFLLQPGKTYRLHGEIPVDKFPADRRNFVLILSVSGKVSIDQVSLVPY